MITLDGIPLILQDPDGHLDALIEKYHSMELMQHLVPHHEKNVNRGTNLLFTNYPDPPVPRLNQLVVPTGATRWSYGVFLATGKQVEKIYEKTVSLSPGDTVSMNRLELVMTTGMDEIEDIDPSITNVSAFPFEPNTIRMTVSPLPPRPVPVRELGDNFPGLIPDEVDGLWLIPVVDARYWWQYKNVGNMSSDYVEPEDVESPPSEYGKKLQEPSDLILYMNSLVDERLDWCGQSEYYISMPKIFQENNHENFAVVLESICWYMGGTIVPDFCRFDVLDKDTGEGEVLSQTRFVFIDGQSSDVVYKNNETGKLGLYTKIRPDESTPDHFGNVPGVSPIQMMGGSFNDIGIAVPETVFVGSDGAFTSVDSYEVGFSDSSEEEAENHHDVERGAVAVIRVAYEDREQDPEETEYTPAKEKEQVAKDYYARFNYQYDITMAGVQPWQPVITTDYVVFQRTYFSDGFRCFTRARSHPHNLIPSAIKATVTEEVVSSDGGGGSGCSCSCIENTDLTITNSVTGEDMNTTRNWIAEIGPVVIRQEHGRIILRSGNFLMTWDEDREVWFGDIYAQLEEQLGGIGGLLAGTLVAIWNNGDEATDLTTFNKVELEMEYDVDGWSELRLTIDAEVPEPPDPPE